MQHGKLVMTDGKARVYRQESYNHRTTANVEWIVVYTQPTGKDVVARTCATRKDAVQWASIYSN